MLRIDLEKHDKREHTHNCAAIKPIRPTLGRRSGGRAGRQQQRSGRHVQSAIYGSLDHVILNADCSPCDPTYFKERPVPNPIWCPSIDAEMRDTMTSAIISLPSMSPHPLEGGSGGLGNFNPLTDKLYIVAHGHSEMPVFSCNKNHFTPTRLVAMLEADGLPKNWRDIELLVCHAGESVNSIKVGNQLVAIATDYKAAKAAGKSTASAEAKYAATNKKSSAPSAFVDASQLLPLAAQFTQALKDAKFTNFRVISYAAPVCQYYGGGLIHLDTSAIGGGWGTPITSPTCADLIKVWH
jgi:hypothetical protein